MKYLNNISCRKCNSNCDVSNSSSQFNGPFYVQDAVLSIKGNRGILPINPASLVQVNVVNATKHTGKMTKGAVTDITSGLIKVGDNVKNAMGDLLSGNLFQDDSSHGHNGSNNGASNGG